MVGAVLSCGYDIDVNIGVVLVNLVFSLLTALHAYSLPRILFLCLVLLSFCRPVDARPLNRHICQTGRVRLSFDRSV